MTALPDVHRRPIGRATLGDQLRRHARRQPDKPAVISYSAAGDRSVCTYADLDRRANRFAHRLIALGVRRGDRVAMMGRNSVELIVAYYGTLKAGAAFTVLNVLFRADEVRHQVEHSGASVILADPEFVDLLRGLDLDPLLLADTPSELPDSEPDVDVDEHDLAMMVYTSGTEAAPKGVLIPHRNYLISTAPSWGWGLTGPDDVWLFVMPFHTISGLGSTTSLTVMGATLVLPATTDPALSLRIIGTERITVIAQTPTFYLALSAHADFGPDTVGSVRRCMTYGGQLSPRTIAAWSAANPDVLWGTYWGQSELSQLGTVGWFRTLDDIPGGDPTWIGRPVAHLETRVVGPDGHDAESGELWCRSPSVMLGYHNDPERTAAVLDGGWVHTGDMVRVDGEGNLFFTDRIKDVIKSGGMNVSSQEVERVLHRHPAVLRAAVVGLPDEYWSEAVTAFVTPADSAAPPDPAALIAFCREHLAVYKSPKSVIVLDELPTDAQGKILKRTLRATHTPPS